MANKLLDTLQQIEYDRQKMIRKANTNGYNFANNASFAELGTAFDQLYDSDNEFTSKKLTKPYNRPTDYPDLHAILNNSPEREGYHAGFIMLIYADYPTIKFWPYAWRTKSTNTVSIKTPEAALPNCYSHGSAIGANRVLLSDGAWLDVENITDVLEHEWDTTKDIETSDGKIRYIIGYVDDVERTSLMYNYYEPIELLVGRMNINKTNNAGYCSFFTMDNNVGPRIVWGYKNNLRSFEILPTCNNGNYYYINTTGMSGYCLAGNYSTTVSFNPLLARVIIPTCAGFCSSSSPATLDLTNVHEHDLSNFKGGNYSTCVRWPRYRGKLFINIDKTLSYKTSDDTCYFTEINNTGTGYIYPEQNVNYPYLKKARFGHATSGTTYLVGGDYSNLQEIELFNASSIIRMQAFPSLEKLKIHAVGNISEFTIQWMPLLEDFQLDTQFYFTGAITILNCSLTKEQLWTILNCLDAGSTSTKVITCDITIRRLLGDEELNYIQEKGWSIKYV